MTHPSDSQTTTLTDGASAIGDDSALLTRAVRLTTGLMDAEPRPGQDALHVAIVRAMERGAHTVGQAPTGSGKSFAALSAAFLASIRRGERTVISTDSLALMAQLQDKDVPIVIEAASALYPGIEVRVGFLKGVANYIDPARVISTAQALSGEHSLRYGDLADAIESGGALKNIDQFPNVEAVDHEALRRLVVWACRAYAADDENEPGDRHSCPVEHTTEMWSTVSSASSEADDGSRYAVTPKATLAREGAAMSDIVVTNHSILAVQAAKSVPVIVGSQKIGPIDHLIIDEAHSLPGHVRSQGAAKLSGGTLTRVGRATARACANSTTALNWRDAGDLLGEEVEKALKHFAEGGDRGVRRVKDTDDLLGGLAESLIAWLQAGKKLIGKKDQSNDVTTRLRASAAKESLSTMKETIESLSSHRSGWARWVEKDDFPEDSKHREWWGAHVSPIDVGFLLRDNLWGYNVTSGDVVERVELSVSAISATMPSNFSFQSGLNAQLMSYPSPFADAYSMSALYIPSVSGGAQLEAITSEAWGGKRRFDVRGHAKWASDQIVQLVRVNGGRALVLSATARDGRAYAAALRDSLPDITIRSQWDGGSVTRIVGDWRADLSSVLVGTKTLFTGVDAPGDTCTLTVIDRVPRSPSNPLDEARVEQINERIGDEWEAQRAVYAVDAALLLQQAAGRLIRASDDVGMVAILDPRMLKATSVQPAPLAYPERTRQTYMGAVRDFGRKLTTLEGAIDFLRSGHAAGRS